LRKTSLSSHRFGKIKKRRSIENQAPLTSGQIGKYINLFSDLRFHGESSVKNAPGKRNTPEEILRGVQFVLKNANY